MRINATTTSIVVANFSLDTTYIVRAVAYTNKVRYLSLFLSLLLFFYKCLFLYLIFSLSLSHFYSLASLNFIFSKRKIHNFISSKLHNMIYAGSRTVLDPGLLHAGPLRLAQLRPRRIRASVRGHRYKNISFFAHVRKLSLAYVIGAAFGPKSVPIIL